MLLPVIRTVIFDLDGTLVHSLPGIAASLNRVLEQNAFPTHPESAVRGFIGDGMRMLIERALPHPISSNTLDTMVIAMKDDYTLTWKEGTTPYPGVIETLTSLSKKGTAIAICSNKPHVFCQKITDALFPHITFSKIIGQRDGIPSKPDPVGAIKIAAQLNTPVSETAFLGDSTIDLITAKNAGMVSIAATWGYHDPPALAAENPDYSIDHISDLLTTITPTV